MSQEAVNRGAFSSRLAVAGLVWLALLALLVTIGGAVGFVLTAPGGAFHGVDRAAGLAFGVVLLAALLFPRAK